MLPLYEEIGQLRGELDMPKRVYVEDGIARSPALALTR
jgi:hypothetical protein